MIEWVEEPRAGFAAQFGTGGILDDGRLLVACDIRSDKDVRRWPSRAGSSVSPAQGALAPSFFEVLCITPTALDVLDLVRHPHRRRGWEWEEAGWSVRDVNP